MNVIDLFTILRTVIMHPELINYLGEEELSCDLKGTYFGIKVCCGGYGATLTLHDNSKVDFDLHDEDKETFAELFKAVGEQSRKYNYEKLLKELNRYESFRNNLGNYQSV